MEISTTLKRNILDKYLSAVYIPLYAMYTLSVLIPLVIGSPQLLVGSMINFLIVYSSLTYGIKKSIPILILPSLTVLATGLLFGGATYFLLYTFPIIILSNLILSYFVSKKEMKYYILGVLLKGLIIVLLYIFLSKTVGLPSILLTSSYLQFVTATIGVSMGSTLFNITRRYTV